MLLKQNRVDKKTVEEIFKEGKFVNSPSLTFKFVLKKGNTLPKISFIAPKRVAKLAIKRNLLKRRGYSAFKKQIKDFPIGLFGVFIFKRHQDDASILENEIKTILHKLY